MIRRRRKSNKSMKKIGNSSASKLRRLGPTVKFINQICAFLLFLPEILDDSFFEQLFKSCAFVKTKIIKSIKN